MVHFLVKEQDVKCNNEKKKIKRENYEGSHNHRYLKSIFLWTAAKIKLWEFYCSGEEARGLHLFICHVSQEPIFITSVSLTGVLHTNMQMLTC